VTLPACAAVAPLLLGGRRPCSNRLISPARRAHSSKPAMVIFCNARLQPAGIKMLVDSWGKQTDGQTAYHYINPASSVNNSRHQFAASSDMMSGKASSNNMSRTDSSRTL